MTTPKWIHVEPDAMWVNDEDRLAVSERALVEAKCPSALCALDTFPRQLLEVWYQRYRDSERVLTRSV